jgi:uncharacterized protein YbjT (DUF2867 family)
MILVIGGLSKIGSALIEELVSLGEHVRALVRKSEGVDSFAAAVETIVGDLGDPGSLHRAMHGGRQGVPFVRTDTGRGRAEQERDRGG